MIARLVLLAILFLCATSPVTAQEKPATRDMLRREARISGDSARKIALARVPGTITEGDLEREHGKLVWSFDIRVAGKPGVEEVQVDALTGDVVSQEHESPKAEAKEAAAERKKQKATKKPPR